MYVNYDPLDSNYMYLNYNVNENELFIKGKLKTISLGKLIKENNIDSIYRDSSQLYLCRIEISKNFKSLLCLHIQPIDHEYREYTNIKLILLNINYKNKLISSANIGAYERNNDGRSLWSVDTNIKVLKNLVCIELLETMYPFDIGFRFKSSDFTTIHNFQLETLDDGTIKQIK